MLYIFRKCRIMDQCGREVLREIAYCYTEGSFCQQWLQTQFQKTPAFETRPGSGSPANAMRRMQSEQPEVSMNDLNYIMTGKGYRGPEYTPLKLSCGIVRSGTGRRSMSNMLKIIGGRAARKGEWPWQVAILNRFKEAFCGGTLIAPRWVLTAAHCVRKVLFVRIGGLPCHGLLDFESYIICTSLGEHNLNYEDGTEIQLRVMKSYTHPNFDKRTVDSDVALLRWVCNYILIKYPIKSDLRSQVTQGGQCHHLDWLLLFAAALPGAAQKRGLHYNWLGQASQSGCHGHQCAPQGHRAHHTDAELPQGLLRLHNHQGTNLWLKIKLWNNLWLYILEHVLCRASEGSH